MPTPPPLPKVPPPLPPRATPPPLSYQGEPPPVIDEYNQRQNALRQKKRRNAPTSQDPISNIEWGLILFVLLIIDLIQFGLVLLAIGLVVNRFIDIAVGFLFYLYCMLRGIMMGAKQITSLLTTFGIEFLGPGDALPLWIADGALIMAWHKAAQKAKQTAVGNIAVSALEIKGGRKMNKQPQRTPPVIPPSQTPPPLPQNSLTAQQYAPPPLPAETPPPLGNVAKPHTGPIPPRVSPPPLAGQEPTPPKNVIDLRDEFKKSRDKKFDPRYNPDHSRNQGRGGEYKEAA